MRRDPNEQRFIGPWRIWPLGWTRCIACRLQFRWERGWACKSTMEGDVGRCDDGALPLYERKLCGECGPDRETANDRLRSEAGRRFCDKPSDPIRERPAPPAMPPNRTVRTGLFGEREVHK